MTARGDTGIGPLAVVGAVVWVAGFALEVAADRQKRAFRADPANAGRFITSGVWAWSRHPNYFGEITLWCGIALIALPALGGWQYVTLVSPVFVTALLTRVSGIPMLERRSAKRWGDDPEYRRYVERTPVLVPRAAAPFLRTAPDPGDRPVARGDDSPTGGEHRAVAAVAVADRTAGAGVRRGGPRRPRAVAPAPADRPARARRGVLGLARAGGHRRVRRALGASDVRDDQKTNRWPAAVVVGSTWSGR